MIPSTIKMTSILAGRSLLLLGVTDHLPACVVEFYQEEQKEQKEQKEPKEPKEPKVWDRATKSQAPDSPDQIYLKTIALCRA